MMEWALSLETKKFGNGRLFFMLLFVVTADEIVKASLRLPFSKTKKRAIVKHGEMSIE